ncbi:Glycosyl transferases family 1 [Proteiniphilum saccharofermentans]|uniref:Glycosyl transferases family 1 n=1 Tax=Proteiniphilum saccharofermentans TaxID=1642647 RepID=A0A1R3TA82_9BACT|nr:glycosyltransferase [Proteiniphilum saccharofermentans]SCD20504.1 Glycosyl transferases family 1 [Proteiniphilum saccharofermentans]
MNKKRKILWFSSLQFSNEKIKTTGTWLIAMGDALAKSPGIELYNVSYGDVKSITQNNVSNINQWIIPDKEREKCHEGTREVISFIIRINQEIKPDLIQVWGTESGLGFSVIKAKLQTPILLDIQGLLFTIPKNYYGGLSRNDLLGCIGLKEILRPQNHPYFIRKEFEKNGKHEWRLIQQMENISVQSDWVNSIVQYVSPKSNIFHTGIMLRREFYETPIWEYQNNSQTINIFTSCSGAIPYKGLQVLFEAIVLLKNKYPNIKLNIGGDIQINKKYYGLIRDGYTSWLLKKVKKLGITDSISWLGKMDVDAMIAEIHRSSLVVIPSFVETYSLFMAECMMVGVPIAASFAGAMPQLAEHNKSALYFPTGDHWACARQIEKIITDQELAKKLSAEARKTALQRNDQTKVLQIQLEIYDRIINATY